MSKAGLVGKVVLGIVTKYRRGSKWKRGALVKGVLVLVGKERRRPTGSWVRMGSQKRDRRDSSPSGAGRVVLVNKKRDPMANRSRRVMCRERRGRGYGKVLARAAYVV